MFIPLFDKGSIFISKKYINKIFKFLENNQDERDEEFIDQFKADRYSIKDFGINFRTNLQADRKKLVFLIYFIFSSFYIYFHFFFNKVLAEIISYDL